MRIIAGEFRSRTIQGPEGLDKTRPMPDRVRESLFSLLRGHLEGQNVVDAFAGTGSIGLEAISRGAARCMFIERDREIGELLKSNIETLGVDDRAYVVVGDVLGASSLARSPRPLHLVFFDPPFPMVLEPASRKRVFDQFGRFVRLLDDDGYAILRTPWPFIEPPPPPPELAPRAVRSRTDDEDEDHGADPFADFEPEGDPDADPNAAALAIEEAHAAPRGLARTISLDIPGAIGPETHVYGSSAVHLYMKRPDTDPGAGSGSDTPPSSAEPSPPAPV